MIRTSQDAGAEVVGTSAARGALMSKAHRLLYLSTLGLGVIKKKRKTKVPAQPAWADQVTPDEEARRAHPIVHLHPTP